MTQLVLSIAAFVLFLMAALVVFLRSMSKQSKPSGLKCWTCHRVLRKGSPMCVTECALCRSLKD